VEVLLMSLNPLYQNIFLVYFCTTIIIHCRLDLVTNFAVYEMN